MPLQCASSKRYLPADSFSNYRFSESCMLWRLTLPGSVCFFVFFWGGGGWFLFYPRANFSPLRRKRAVRLCHRFKDLLTYRNYQHVIDKQVWYTRLFSQMCRQSWHGKQQFQFYSVSSMPCTLLLLWCLLSVVGLLLCLFSLCLCFVLKSNITPHFRFTPLQMKLCLLMTPTSKLLTLCRHEVWAV